MRKIIEFLEGNDSVKVLVSHRRRQNSSIDDKKDLIEKIAAHVADVGSLQGDVKIIGNNIRTLFVSIQKIVELNMVLKSLRKNLSNNTRMNKKSMSMFCVKG